MTSTTSIVPADYQAEREHALATIRVSEEDDDQALLEILGGELVNKYVYSFPRGGKEIRGLSFAGYREWASYRGNFKMDKPEVEDLGDEYRVMVQIHDLERNVSIWAGTHQPKMQTFTDPKRKPELDPFAFEKAISKAQRNALKNLMPVTMVEAAIGRFVALGAGGSQQGTPRAIEGSQRRNGKKGTGEIPDGSPKDLGQLFKWSFDSFGYYQPVVLGILDVKKPDEIEDLKAAWEKVKAYAAAQASAPAEETPEEGEPAEVPPGDESADVPEPDYPSTGEELIDWARSTWSLSQDQLEAVLGKRVGKIEDLPAAWTELVAVMAKRGEG